MKKLYKNRNFFSQEGIFAKIERQFFWGKAVILLFDLLFAINRRLQEYNKESGVLIVISLHRIGDTVFTIPAVKEILNKYKSFKKLIICFPESNSIYKNVFNEEIIIMNKHDFIMGLRLVRLKGRNVIKNLKPEIIFDLTGTITSASLIFNSGASLVVGMHDRIFKNIYTHFTKRRKVPHLIDVYLDPVEKVFSFKRSEDIYLFKRTFSGKRNILIHPFSAYRAKEWGLKKFIELSDFISKKYPVEFVAPENFLSSEIKEYFNKENIPLSITKTMDELIVKIKEGSVFISNDTGPLYIANLLGKPTYTIYGPTNPEFSLPFGDHHQYIRKKITCSPESGKQYCFTMAGVYCPANECMNQLSVKEVYESLKLFLNNIGL